MTITSVVITAECDICGNSQSTDMGNLDTARSLDFQQFLRSLGWWTRSDFSDICPKHEAQRRLDRLAEIASGRIQTLNAESVGDPA